MVLAFRGSDGGVLWFLVPVPVVPVRPFSLLRLNQVPDTQPTFFAFSYIPLHSSWMYLHRDWPEKKNNVLDSTDRSTLIETKLDTRLGCIQYVAFPT